MKYSIVLATSNVWGPEFLDIAQQAELAGFDRLWTTERAGRDGLIRAAEVAMATERIGVGTGITFAFTRNPVAMAGAAAELDRLSGQRFTLGLGTGTRGVRRWFGEEFDHPAPRLAEYAALVRAALEPRTEGLKFEGRFYSAQVPSFEGVAGRGGSQAPSPRVPIYAGGLNRIMLTAMAQACDGVAVHPLAVGAAYMDSVVGPALSKGNESRTAGAASVASWLLVSVDDDVQQAMLAARGQLAFYFCTPSYKAVADACGWGKVAETLQQEFSRIGPDWDTLGKLLPEAMVHEFCPAGTVTEVAAALNGFAERLAAHGVDEIVLEPAVMGRPPAEVVRAFQNAVPLKELLLTKGDSR